MRAVRRFALVNSLLLLAAATAVPAAPRDADVPFLLKQRDAFTNWPAFKQRRHVSGWNESTPLCEWTGVTCAIYDDWYFVNFGCPACNTLLEGKLAPELANCSQLHTLDLAPTKLTGTLPDVWASGLRNLFILVLADSQLSGTLPNAWSPGMHNLTYVRLEGNKLTGTLPDGWGAGDFRKLKSISLQGNQITGTIPSSWGVTDPVVAFPALESLSLAGTQVCGLIPDDIVVPVCKVTTCVGGNLSTPCANTPPAAEPPLVLNSVTPAVETSSVPIGAIVGGAVGGLVLLAALAFLALRPRKGWLRKKQTYAFTNDTAVAPDVEKLGRIDSGVGSHTSYEVKDSFVGTEGLPPANSNKRADIPLTKAHAVLPVSYVSSGGDSAPPEPWSPGSDAATSAPLIDTFLPRESSPVVPASQTVSQLSGSTDPLLSFINSRMAALQPPNLAAGQLAPSGQLISRGSSALAAEVQQWEVQFSEIEMEDPIGRGSYGWVYKARLQGGAVVACKVLINSGSMLSEQDLRLPEATMRELQAEAAVMARMRHPNCTAFVGLCVLPPCILTEFMRRGSVCDVLQAATRNPEKAAELTWHRRIGMALDAACGILYLHTRSPPIVHRDIKSPNLLVDTAWTVKVADFNLSKVLSATPGASTTSIGGGANNPLWLAPEILEGGHASPASDVYAFGLVCWELLTWQLPWTGTPHFRVAHLVLQEGARPGVPPLGALPGPDAASFAGMEAYCQLMRECWAQAPQDRPTFAEIVPRLRALHDAALPGTA